MTHADESAPTDKDFSWIIPGESLLLAFIFFAYVNFGIT